MTEKIKSTFASITRKCDVNINAACMWDVESEAIHSFISQISTWYIKKKKKIQSECESHSSCRLWRKILSNTPKNLWIHVHECWNAINSYSSIFLDFVCQAQITVLKCLLSSNSTLLRNPPH